MQLDMNIIFHIYLLTLGQVKFSYVGECTEPTGKTWSMFN